jgi:WD40 repeat protein
MDQDTPQDQPVRSRSTKWLKWVLGCTGASIFCLTVVIGLWADSALKPCQALDLMLQKSGCLEVTIMGDTGILKLSGDGNILAGYVTHPEDHVEFLNLGTGKIKTIQYIAESLGGGETDIALSADGQYAAVITPLIGVPRLALVDLSVEVPGLRELRLPRNDQAIRAAFSPDGQTLAVAVDSETDYVVFFDLPGGNLAGQLDLAGDNMAVTFTPDGRLATGYGGEVQLWDLNQQVIVQSIGTQLPSVRSITFSADGRSMAVSTGDPINVPGSMVAYVFRVNDGQSLYKFGEKGETRQWNNLPVNFSPDGSLLAVSSCDSADIYRLEDGELVTSFIRLWDINTFVYTDCLSAVQFLPDGKSAYYSWTNGGVVRWKLP